MSNRTRILVINSSFPEVNQLAAALAEHDLLSYYVRPYANLGRVWEQGIAKLPEIGKAYSRTFGRRIMLEPLSRVNVKEVVVFLDMLMALHSRLPIRAQWYRDLRKKLMYRIGDVIAESGEKALSDERMVVASWGCALPAFGKAAQHGIIRVLNYSLAHHAFTRRYLREEAELEPGFSNTLNSCNRPRWQIDRLDQEIELADHILVGSSFVKDTFVAEGVQEDKLVVIPYGVDTEFFKPTEKQKHSDRFNIVFVGQLTQRKGLSYLLRAYERFHEPKTSLTLIGKIQGNGAEFEPWRHLFKHVPHVPQSELAGLFQQADVFVFPTLVEGMPLVVVEAMACGLPVITTRNGPGDIVRDGVDGFIVPPRDVDAILERLGQLRDDPDLRFRMALNARLRSQEFTWERYRCMAVVKIRQWLGRGLI
jgi:glycosyltransferase involved in cell wall biosynthesis